MTNTESNTVSYPVMEHFYTLQGEGLHTGRAAYFIRLGGCDVGCVWCDVKESWDASIHPQMTANEITQLAAANPGRIAVITGGEPALHDLTALCNLLHGEGFKTHIETSGSSPIVGAIDWVTLSPKKFKAPIQEALDLANELKVVVYHHSDFKWAEEHAAKVGKDCLLYLQPEWSKRDSVTPLIIDYIQQHPQWQLSLQTHKYINIP
ncbi:7-carboxy-7-deazaguanine synthase QueE [Flavipsychrobacter stenotrophus]|nr:7-carboxy-7-deazaguanine synthase QueE [Flavipsychrobacter stenotrophus]